MRVDGSGQAGSGWSRCADCAGASIERCQLTIRGGHLNNPRRLTLQANSAQSVGLRLVVEDSKPTPNGGFLPKTGKGKNQSANESGFPFLKTRGELWRGGPPNR